MEVVTDAAEMASAVYAADIDGDADLDVFAATESDEVSWYENDGAQQFTARLISEKGEFSRAVHAADTNNDGDVDLLLACEDSIKLFHNDGEVTFQGEKLADDYATAAAVTAADITGTGVLAPVAGAFETGRVAWFESARRRPRRPETG